MQCLMSALFLLLLNEPPYGDIDVVLYSMVLVSTELELRVVNLTTLAQESEDMTYSAEDSETTFSIPLKTLSDLSKGESGTR